MVTPDRLRRRQRREALLIAVLAVALAGGWVYFRDRTETILECVVEYAETDSATDQARSYITERESEATREVIRAALRAERSSDIVSARNRYDARLERIDEAREANPVARFDVESCSE